MAAFREQTRRPIHAGRRLGRAYGPMKPRLKCTLPLRIPSAYTRAASAPQRKVRLVVVVHAGYDHNLDAITRRVHSKPLSRFGGILEHPPRHTTSGLSGRRTSAKPSNAALNIPQRLAMGTGSASDGWGVKTWLFGRHLEVRSDLDVRSGSDRQFSHV